MSRTRSTTVWPIMLALALLFGVSVTAPRSWEPFAQRRPLEPARGFSSGSYATAENQSGHSRSSTAQTEARVPQATIAAAAGPRITSEFQPNVSRPVATGPTATTVAQGARPSVSGSPALSGASTPAATPTISRAPLLAGNSKPTTIPAAAPSGTATLDVGSTPVEVAVSRLTPTLSGLPAQGGAATVAGPTQIGPTQIGPTQIGPTQIGPTHTVPTHTVPTHVQPIAPPAAAANTAVPVPTAPATATVATTEPTYAPPTRAGSIPPGGYLRLNGASASAALTPAPVAGRIEASTPAAGPIAPAPSAQSRSPAGLPAAVVAVRTGDPSQNQKPLIVPVLPATKPASEPNAATVVPENPSWWPRPTDLFVRLERLEAKPETKVWARDAAGILGRLSQSTEPAGDRLKEILGDLRRLLADTRRLDESKLDTATAVEVRLARHAIQRRLDIWESLSHVLSDERPMPAIERADQLKLCLVDIDRQTNEAGDVGRQWRNYLLLDSLDHAAAGATDELQTRALAREVLSRLRRAGTNAERNQFLREGAFAELDTHLRHLATDEIDGRSLLASIEKFEIGGLPSDAKELADECRRLQYSTDDERRQLAVWMTSHYRNANIRLTLSADILNRMMPEELRQSAPVRDTILGNVTQGWSTTRTGVGVRFLPSDDTLAVRFEAQGQVNAETQTFSGPVRLFSHSNSTFTAYKDLSLALDGFHVTPAKARTQSRSRLRGIRTDFDHLPILSNIIESIALDEHAALRGAAQREAAGKISLQVQRGLDAEINAHLTTADARLNERLIGPLSEVKLSPEIIELQSNEQRAIVRMRIAGDDQLAAYTPRPRAYNDNVGSLQIHQSALNNLLERSNLAGRRFTALELYRHFVTQFQLPDELDVSQLPADAEVTFAEVDPVTVRFDSGTIELRLAIAELKSGSRVWRDFVARTPFKPKVVDGEICLCRDGLIRISGKELGTGGQISLRTAFAKIFPDDMNVDLWPAELKSDPRFSDLTIAQVDLRDGWLAVAVGPQRHYPQATLPPPRRR